MIYLFRNFKQRCCRNITKMFYLLKILVNEVHQI